jgi:hypothetical protein
MQLLKISVIFAALAGFAFAKPVEGTVGDEPGKLTSHVISKAIRSDIK